MVCRDFKRQPRLNTCLENRYACGHPDCLTRDASPHFANWTQLQKHNKTVHAPRCSFEDCQFLSFKSHKALVQHLAAEHGQDEEGHPVEVPKTRKRKAKKVVLESVSHFRANTRCC
jgi:hypothetical protein